MIPETLWSYQVGLHPQQNILCWRLFTTWITRVLHTHTHAHARTRTQTHRANTRYRASLFTAICGGISRVGPIPVAAWSKAWVYGRSLASIAGSNAAGGMDVVSCESCVPDFRLPPLFWAVIQRRVNWILGIWTLPIRCPETSVRNYHYTLRHSPELSSQCCVLRRADQSSRGFPGPLPAVAP